MGGVISGFGRRRFLFGVVRLSFGYRVINRSGPMRAVNPRTRIKNTNYLEQDFQLSLKAFSGQRVDRLAVLEPLSQEGWSREAIITGAKKVLFRSVVF